MSKSGPLAIVGISCIFPKAEDLQAYWANVKNGVDAITPIPVTHWKAADFFHHDPKAPDLTYAQRGGFLPTLAFNPMEHGIAPKDIEATDTTQLLGLVAAKQALADAGYADKTFNRDRTSVILGVTGALELVIPLGARLGHPLWRRALKEAGVADQVADDVVQRIAEGYVPWQENSFPGLLGNVAAGRIASRLDLGGTNCVVDAACASSLAALHLAALELEAGRSDMVITGGIDTFNDIFMYMCFSKTPALSPSGDAKPFDKACDGTILGEGLGMLVLKRLADAERDGDRIYCTIRGMGSSSDGRGGAIYEPRSEGQQEALLRAYAAAEVSPETIDLIEAHGTGTKVGDATELRSLTTVFRKAQPAGTWAALGSVKSQIGHTKAAAGIAGLIKAALALDQKILPPTIKVTQPLDEAASGNSPFYINTTKRPWLPRAGHARRAGVSAFGFGGTNFHCVLEEHASARRQVSWDGDVDILALCASTREDLRAQVAALPDAMPWDELRQQAHASRQSFQHQAAFRLLIPLTLAKNDHPRTESSVSVPQMHLAGLRDMALAALDRDAAKTSWHLPNGIAFGSGPARGKLAVLFPGQGSQFPGMCRDLACQFPEMLEALAEADVVFAEENAEANQRLSDFIYPQPAFSDEGRRAQEEALKATEVAQPALGAVSLGALGIFRRFGVKPAAAAGHSYGELPALHTAGRLATEALHTLSNVRGRLMASRNGHSDRGGMLAVIAPEQTVTEVLAATGGKLVVANRNSPAQFVLAGPRADIERTAGELHRRSIRSRVLQVSAAFHSPLVADAREPFAAALQDVEFGPGQLPVYANVTAAAYPDDHGQTRDLLVRQMVSQVDFFGQIEAMHADGATTFLELGPGHVLSDLVQAILSGRPADTIAVDSSRGTRSGTLDLAMALCRLGALGHEVDLKPWENAPAPAAKQAKPAFTVPLSGANYRTPRPQRPPVKPVPSTPVSPPPAAVRPSPAPLSSELASALQVAQQGILSLQKLQEQTAQLHQQFLAGQDAARRTIEQLLGQRRALLTGSPAEFSAPAAPLPVAPPVSPMRLPNIAEMAPAPAATPALAAPPQVATPPAVAPAPSKAPAVAARSSSVQEAAQALLAVVAEKTGYPVEMLNLEMGLDSDLGVDSIKRVEIMAALRARLPGAPEIKSEHLGTLQTLQQVVDFLTAGQTVAAPAAVAEPAAASPVTNATAVPAPAASSLAQAEAAHALLEVVSEKTGYPTEMLNLDMGLDSDLGVDSIKRVEIMAALRTKLPAAPEIKSEDLGRLRTLQEVVDFLCAGAPVAAASSVAPTATVPAAATAAASAPSTEVSAPSPKARPAATLSRQVLQTVALPSSDDRAAVSFPAGSLVWLTDDGSALAAAWASGLEKLGLRVRRGRPAELLEKSSEQPGVLLLLWPASGGGDAFVQEAFRLMQAGAAGLRAAGRSGWGTLISVSRLDGQFGLGNMTDAACPVSIGLAGLVKTASHEWPEVRCKALDIDPHETDFARLAEGLLVEVQRTGPLEVGIAQGQAYRLVAMEADVTESTAPALRSGDVVVVTGGARGVTAASTLALARRVQPKFLLLGRTKLQAAEPEWLAGLTDAAAIKKALLEHADGARSPKRLEAKYREWMAQREIRGQLAELRAAGAEAHYVDVDVRDAAAVRAAIERARGTLGPIRGLIHGAGVLADKLIEQKTAAQFDLVYGTKVEGLRHLLEATAGDELHLLALFSSYTGRFGRAAQADYAAANEVLNKMAQAEARRRPACRVVALNWGPWNGGMVTDGLRKIFLREGVGLIETEAGADFLVREALAGPTEAVEVVVLAPAPVSKAANVLGGTAKSNGAPHSPALAVADSFTTAFDREVSLHALPCLGSHVMNGRAVLPAALMIEWLAQGAVHSHPGLAFHGLDQFKVLKGLILEGDATVQVRVSAGPPQPREPGLLSVPVHLSSRHGTGTPFLHATAEILLTESLPVAPAVKPAVARNGILSRSVYGDGRLFHGPDFQSIEALEVCDSAAAAALVRSAPAPKQWIQAPLRPAWLADPLALDAAFQLMILWSTTQRAAPSLPCALRSFRQFAAFPKTGGSRVVARITSAMTPVAVADLQFFDRDGHLLALAEGYEFVVDPNLRDAFRLNRLPA